MSFSNQTFRGSATLTPPTAPKLYNIFVLLANTEVSQVLTSGTKKLRIKALGNSRIQYAWNTGESGGAGPFWPIARGGVLPIEDINYTGSIYFQTSEPGETVIIEEWT